ncbi:MAG: M28 family peptidase, partial [Bacteroidota bacterium]
KNMYFSEFNDLIFRPNLNNSIISLTLLQASKTDLLMALATIFEQLKAYPKRLRRTEKEAFLQEAIQLFDSWGYKTRRLEKKGKIWTSINLETKVTSPEFIILAHYDTPIMLPPWIEPFVRIFGHTRPFLLSVVLLLFFALVIYLPGKIFAITAILLGLSFLLMLLPNPKNYNDNTSGVLGLLSIAEQLKNIPKAKKRVKFVLVDNEEMILTGAEHLRDSWEEEGASFGDARILSLDCIGWGKQPVIIRNGPSYVGVELLSIFQEEKPESKLVNMGLMPLNDNYIFRDSGAVLVSYMDKAALKNSYYIKNIHSIFDKRLDLNKIKWITDNILEYMKRQDAF